MVEREREREREREVGGERARPALAYESLLISKNIMYQLGAENDTCRYFLCASAFARQSRIFDSIDALHAFYRMPNCLKDH